MLANLQRSSVTDQSEQYCYMLFEFMSIRVQSPIILRSIGTISESYVWGCHRPFKGKYCLHYINMTLTGGIFYDYLITYFHQLPLAVAFQKLPHLLGSMDNASLENLKVLVNKFSMSCKAVSLFPFE